MMKPIPVKVVSFEEFVEYGLKHTDNIVNGMPWSFEYEGQSATHENDDCYIISTPEGFMHFTSNDVLVGIVGCLYGRMVPFSKNCLLNIPL